MPRSRRPVCPDRLSRLSNSTGEAWLPGRVEAQLRTLGEYAVTAVLDYEETTAIAGLADMDRQILHLVADGMTSKEIARTLDRSPFTIDSRLKDVCQKLGADTRAQAAAMLLRAEAESDTPRLGGGPAQGLEPGAQTSPDAREDGAPQTASGRAVTALASGLSDPRLGHVMSRLLMILVGVAIAAFLLANAIAAVQGVFLTALRG